MSDNSVTTKVLDQNELLSETVNCWISSDKKIFVLDTNVLMADPDAIFKFDDNLVIIPDVVIEELDSHKKDMGDRGYNVRQVHRNFENLMKAGNLSKGIPTSDDGMIFVVHTHADEMPSGWTPNKPDNLIIMTAKWIQSLATNPDRVILVSNDINVQIKSDEVELVSELYKNERIEDDFLNYTGRASIEITDKSFQKFLTTGKITADVIKRATAKKNITLVENMFLIVKNQTTGGTLLARIKDGGAIALIFENESPFGITPRNSAQRFCIEALMSSPEEIPLVIMTGPAGTAKTFLALACGLEQTVEKREYRRIVITRANVEFDSNSIGYLPGSEEEKISPLVRGCMDNLELLVDEKGVKNPARNQKEDKVSEKVQYLFDIGAIKAEAMSFLRGRSLTKQYLFVDEAQNTTPSQMKGILTRAGAGAKIVICGDLDQIDNARVDRHNNGLAYAIKLMMGDPLCCIIGQEEKESTRSSLARRVSEKDKGK